MAVDPTSVKVYTVNGAAAGSSSSLPDWLTRKRALKSKGKKRAVREQVEGTIELIQHLEFPEASNRIKTTRDGHHVIATGTYKPQMRVWDLDQLALKFERHTDAENVDFVILSDDWTKTLHLQADRTVELHTQGGFHYRTRIPRFGRALAYHFPSCEALFGAAGNEVYRLNLEQGRFFAPLTLGSGVEGVNAIDINPVHGLWAFGTDGNGTVEFWDPRSRSPVGVLELPRSRLVSSSAVGAVLPGLEDVSGPRLTVTSLTSRSDGLSYAVGTSTGHTLLYDIRSARPFATKDQGYGLPIRRVVWVEGGTRMAGDGLVLSADKKVVKVWDRNTPSSNFTSLTPSNDLNDIYQVPGTGLLMTANEGIQMCVYFVPQLGPAPRWASFLENLTEELEEGAAPRGVYEDYKFVSRQELSQLGMDHLIGTPALKPYMHGYFVSLKLYDAARVIANPYVYEEHRARLVQERIDKLAEGRIRTRRDQPKVKVNKALAEKVARDEERERNKRARRGGEEMEVDDGEKTQEKPNLLTDPRFQALFEDPEFEVDEKSREFALLNPSTVAQRKNGKREAAEDEQESNSDDDSLLPRGKTAVEDEEEESEKAHSDSSEDEESEAVSDDSSEAGDLYPASYKANQAAQQRNPNVRLVPLRAQTSSKTLSEKDSTFGQRRFASSKRASASFAVAADSSEHLVRKTDGSIEMSWIPSSKPKGRRDSDAMDFDEEVPRRGGRKEKDIDRRKGVERFGAGMERGGEDPVDGAELSEVQRSGRKTRRRDVRSGSKNTFRKL
ncbi:WD40-repeat-containing domain protein [Vararia minispora EC-137]|uniref:WD40-repeat-containing domain protein n=1 Tax=Vararia minispora EC-137 TaxID=1314806 RepID=A0ACB8QEW5_9AGAM|nr:WD40-repeat-containing domain protein [Vararia minispora EC-137]